MHKQSEQCDSLSEHGSGTATEEKNGEKIIHRWALEGKNNCVVQIQKNKKWLNKDYISVFERYLINSFTPWVQTAENTLKNLEFKINFKHQSKKKWIKYFRFC